MQLFVVPCGSSEWDFASRPDRTQRLPPFSPHELKTRLIDHRAIFNHDTNPSLAGNPSGTGSRRTAIALCTTQSPCTDPGTTRFKHTSTFSSPNDLRTRPRHLSRSPHLTKTLAHATIPASASSVRSQRAQQRRVQYNLAIHEHERRP